MDRLSILDAEFLHLEDARSPMHIAGLCIFEGAPPSREELERLFSEKLPLMPRYRMRVRWPPLALGRPVWVVDPSFDLGNHVRRTTLPPPGDEGALCALMGRLMSERLDRGRPLWELWIVEGLADGRWAAISKVHHSMVDGISGVKLHELLLESAGGSAPATPPPAGGRTDREPSGFALVLDAWGGLVRDGSGIVRRALGGLSRPANAALVVRDTALGLAVFTRQLLGLATGPIQGTIGPRRVYARGSASLADVQTIRKTLGGSVNDVVLAAVSGAYRTLLIRRGLDADRAHLRSLIPVSVRAPGDGEAAHNRVSAILCDLPLDVASPVDRLRAVRWRMDALKASHMAEAGALIMEVGDLAPPMIVGPLTRLVARAMHVVPQRVIGTVTTNVPGPREPLYLLGRKLVEWYPYVPITQGLRFGTAILSYDGRLGFGITGDWATAPDAAVVAGAIEAEIEALRRIATLSAAPARVAPSA